MNDKLDDNLLRDSTCAGAAITAGKTAKVTKKVAVKKRMLLSLGAWKRRRKYAAIITLQQMAYICVESTLLANSWASLTTD